MDFLDPLVFFFRLLSFLYRDYASHMHPCLYNLNCILMGPTDGTHVILPMSIYLFQYKERRRRRQKCQSKRPTVLSVFVYVSRKRAALKATLGHLGLVVSHHLLKAHTHRPARLPIEGGLGTRGIRPALLRVVLRQTLMYDVDATG